MLVNAINGANTKFQVIKRREIEGERLPDLTTNVSMHHKVRNFPSFAALSINLPEVIYRSEAVTVINSSLTPSTKIPLAARKHFQEPVGSYTKITSPKHK